MEWRGYPQHPDAHPERPWWNGNHRTDGVTLYSPSATTSENIRDPLRIMAHESAEDAMARYDREHPLPVPPPKCGQAWVDGTVHQLVLGVRGSWVQFGGTALFAVLDWPPSGVLVAGPGSPWAPPEVS